MADNDRQREAVLAAVAEQMTYATLNVRQAAERITDAALSALAPVRLHRPDVVVLCGSTRFRAEMAEANRDLTFEGAIVVAPGVFGHSGDEMTEEQKVALDHLHFHKIDLADRVLVVSPGGYIGESTRREIDYAERSGKPVAYRQEFAQVQPDPLRAGVEAYLAELDHVTAHRPYAAGLDTARDHLRALLAETEVSR